MARGRKPKETLVKNINDIKVSKPEVVLKKEQPKSSVYTGIVEKTFFGIDENTQFTKGKEYSTSDEKRAEKLHNLGFIKIVKKEVK